MKKESLLYAKLLFWSVAICVALGCASAPPVKQTVQEPSKVMLAPGNQVEIKFAYAQQFNEIQTIRSDGKIEMQFVGEVIAAGKTPAELREELMKLYAQHLKYPQLAVFVRVSTDNRVFVGGEVKNPGLIDMPGRLTALEAIMQAGGMKPESAGSDNVVVIRQRDGKYQGIVLDLAQPLSGKSADAFYLESRDIVFVPQSTIVSVNQWVAQHINQIVPNIGLNVMQTSPSGRTSVGYSTTNH